jgi:uncharacterized protein YacL
MVCITPCLIAFVLLTVQVVTMLNTRMSPHFKTLDSVLNESQRKIYKKISMERLRIYLEGMVLGLLLALLAVHMLGKKMAFYPKVCLFVIVVIMTNTLYYMIYPKSDYMVKHLETPEQKQAWLNVYKDMKLKHAIGIISGLVGYTLLGYGSMK